MNILVCVKQVPDDYVKIYLDESTGKPAVDGVDKIVNAFDTYAVEMAVRHCEQHGGKVVVATIGIEKEVRASMVQMIAVGANKAYIASPTNDNADEGVIAANLKELIKKCEEEEGIIFDVVLCGKESTDEISSQVGAMLSEKMGVGFVSSVVEFEAQNGVLKVKQETEKGFNYYETICPAVLTVAKPNYDPRYPNLKSKMAARKAVIPYLEGVLSTMESAVHCTNYSEPPKRKAGIKIHEKDTVEAVMKAVSMMYTDKVL